MDLDTLQILSTEDLKELVPVIGHRAKLTTQIAMLRDIVTDAFSDKSTVSTYLPTFFKDSVILLLLLTDIYLLRGDILSTYFANGNVVFSGRSLIRRHK